MLQAKLDNKTFLDPSMEKRWYDGKEAGNFHTMYIGAIGKGTGERIKKESQLGTPSVRGAAHGDGGGFAAFLEDGILVSQSSPLGEGL